MAARYGAVEKYVTSCPRRRSAAAIGRVGSTKPGAAPVKNAALPVLGIPAISLGQPTPHADKSVDILSLGPARVSSSSIRGYAPSAHLVGSTGRAVRSIEAAAARSMVSSIQLPVADSSSPPSNVAD